MIVQWIIADCRKLGVPALAGPEFSCALGNRQKPGLQTGIREKGGRYI